MKATARQVRVIHILKSRLRLDDSVYRELLATYGVASSTQLDFADARELVNRLVHDAVQVGVWRSPAKRWEHLGERHGMASPGQLRKIEVLWSAVSRADGDEAKRAALLVFLGKHFKVAALEWVTSEMVGKIVRTLQAMNHKKEGQYGEARNADETNGSAGTGATGSSRTGASGGNTRGAYPRVSDIRPGDTQDFDRAV